MGALVVDLCCMYQESRDCPLISAVTRDLIRATVRVLLPLAQDIIVLSPSLLCAFNLRKPHGHVALRYQLRQETGCPKFVFGVVFPP